MKVIREAVNSKKRHGKNGMGCGCGCKNGTGFVKGTSSKKTHKNGVGCGCNC